MNEIMDQEEQFLPEKKQRRFHLGKKGRVFVVLLAVVVDANAKYTISWEVCKDGLNWEVLEENADHYSFVVNEVNAVYSYRAVLNVAE